MGFPVVIVPSGGLPVTEAANGFGTPVEIAANGFGFAVTIVASGGLPVIGTGGASAHSFILLEDGSKVLLEDGVGRIIQEP
ncbi:hypothetical protein [Bradyrhizobium roseum]|uniref:hypothetical protein n=1 Tax=Bradyrhizobium roseum TaxID=3056648 RepID=UPI0026064B74|nr:hypothetical protein [Bradyrhizobium roseus]WKA31598.1 hypothetical protein QUH67_16185 [Bradyrhizobium roseus]